MPYLSEIAYSREECSTAVRDYYHFLTKMYLKESAVAEPPKEGWLDITLSNLRGLGKTDEVISLLRRLPIFKKNEEPQGAPWCYFADWQLEALRISHKLECLDTAKICSEDLYSYIPPEVIGLTMGGRNNPVFLLDTKLGVVYWPECPGGITDSHSTLETVLDSPEDYAPENEVEWREDAPAWAVADFFETLKNQFRELEFLPLSPRIVKDTYTAYGPNTDGMLEMLQNIYREHGWPDLEQYRKQDCLKAIQISVEERYPGSEDWWNEEEMALQRKQYAKSQEKTKVL